MKENLSHFTLFIKLFVHFLTLLSKMRFWQPGFTLLVNAAGLKVLMGGAIWCWGGWKGSTCAPLSSSSLPWGGRDLTCLPLSVLFERRLTKPPGAVDANSPSLRFFILCLFSLYLPHPAERSTLQRPGRAPIISIKSAALACWVMRHPFRACPFLVTLRNLGMNSSALSRQTHHLNLDW